MIITRRKHFSNLHKYSTKWKLLLIPFVIIIVINLYLLNNPGSTPRPSDRKLASHADSLRPALELYLADNGSYPEDLKTIYNLYTESLEYNQHFDPFVSYARLTEREYELCVDFEEREDHCYTSP